MYTKKDLSIFLIDDSPVLIEMLRDFILQKHPGAEVSLYNTGEDALKDTYKNPDIIILDYFLDGVHADAMNGIQVLKKLKEELPEIPVVMLSSQDKTEVSANTIRFGAYDYILKNDSAFDKIEIILKNLLVKQGLKKSLGSQVFFNRLLLIVIIVLLGMYFYMRMNN